MSTIVLVAEKEELKLIPLAYQGLPVIITGVGARAYDVLKSLNPQVDLIVNIGYCGALKQKIGTVIYDADAVAVDEFAQSVDDLPKGFDTKKQVVDMESKWIKKWCEQNNCELLMIKVVSDNLSYEQYKDELKKKPRDAMTPGQKKD